MNKPALFMRFNYQAQREFLYLKRKYLNEFNFKENCQVIDIGCGPGDITRHGIFPLLPKTTKKLIGVDISSNMVEFAKRYHQDDRISFQELDIGTSNLPPNFIQSFDHALSFYCLQFVPDPRKAMSNIHLMLKPNGDLLVSILSRLYWCTVYEKLSRTDKWKSYLCHYKDQMSPFLNTPNFKDNFEIILRETGFKVRRYDEVRKVMEFSRTNFEGNMKALNCVEMPKHLEEEFVLDQLGVMRDDDNNVFIDEYGEEQIHFPYSLIIADASKI